MEQSTHCVIGIGSRETMPPRSVAKVKSLKSKVASNDFQKQRITGMWSEMTSPGCSAPNLQIICKDRSLQCNQTILAASSRFLKQLLEGMGLMTGDRSFRESDWMTLYLPDVEGEVMERCLTILYDGFFIPVKKDPTITTNLLEKVKKLWNDVLKIDCAKFNNKNFTFEGVAGDIKQRSFEDHSKVADDKVTLEVAKLQENANKLDYSLHSLIKDEEVSHGELNSIPVTATGKSSVYSPIPGTPSSSISKKRKSSSAETASKTSTMDSSASQQDTSHAKFTDTIKNILQKKFPEAKKVRSERVVYSVERVHVCVICQGKKNGKPDKEALNLSFSQPRKLKEHYSKHFYDEGKIFEFFPVEDRNKNEDGSVKDHFGNMFKYRCDKQNRDNKDEPCWKSKKQRCGYKELALHNATDHDLFEEIIANDEREEIQELLDELQENATVN